MKIEKINNETVKVTDERIIGEIEANIFFYRDGLLNAGNVTLKNGKKVNLIINMANYPEAVNQRNALRGVLDKKENENEN